LSPLEASGQAGAYEGLSLLVVSGKAAGYFSRNITGYMISGAGFEGKRELLLREAMPVDRDAPDESSVVALIALGQVRYGFIASLDVEQNGYHLRVSPLAFESVISLIGKFLRIDSGKGRGVVRQIVGVNQANNTLYIHPAIPAQYEPLAGDMYEILEYKSFVTDLGDKKGGGIQLHGKPMEPKRLSAVATFSASALFEWLQPTLCDTKAGVIAACDVSEAFLEAKMTHNSGDFLVGGEWGSNKVGGLVFDKFNFGLVVAVEPYPGTGKALFSTMAPLASYLVRVRVRHKHVIEFGFNSNVYSLKLTDNPPANVATLGLLTDLGRSDSMELTWTIPGTLDFDTPPYITHFKFRIGEDEAPIAGGLLAQFGRVDTVIFAMEISPIVMYDYMDLNTGKLKLFYLQDVCKYPLDVIRHPYAIPAKALNPGALECRATVYGLEPSRIYVFRVHTGNSFGFETTGSNLMFGSTISLPTVGVSGLQIDSIQTSETRSNYKATLTWARPLGWPVVSRYYVSYAQLLPPSYNTTGLVWRAVAGSGYKGRKVLESSLSPLFYQVDQLEKGARYGMRVHVGSKDGVDGFYADIQLDPTASNIATVLVEDPPLRPRIGKASAALPDRNSILSVSFFEPDVGGKPTSYFAEYQHCGSGPTPVCSTIELAMDDPSRSLLTYTSNGKILLRRFNVSPINLTGLQNNTWYQVRVGASNLAGDGALSLPSAPSRTLALPAPVTDLRITEMTVSTTRLEWRCERECSKAARWFTVLYAPFDASLLAAALRSTSSSRSSGQVQVNVTAGATTAADYMVQVSLDLSNPISNTGTVFRVYAASPQGQEEEGATITLPSAARDLQISSSTDFTLSFSWTPHVAADTFQVLFARPLRQGEDASVAPPFRPAAPETSLSTCSVAGLITGASYRFKVVSRVRGTTPYDLFGSNVVETRPSGLPLPPSLVRVTASRPSEIDLSWEVGSRALRYRVVYAIVDAGGLPTEPFGRPLETFGTSATITGLDVILSKQEAGQRGVALQFKVFAGSYNDFEIVGAVVNLPLISPIGPARAVVVRGSSSVPTWGAVAVSLDWLAAPDGEEPLAYRVTVTTTGAGAGGDVFHLADVLHFGARNSLQSGLVGPLMEGESYSFTVHSKSRQGFYEPFGSAAVVAAAFVVPINLAVKACSTSSVTLRWDMPPATIARSAVVQALRCPEGRFLITQLGSVVTASSEIFQIPCAANQTVAGFYTIQALTNNVVYTLALEARRTRETGGVGLEGFQANTATWMRTAGPNVVETSPIASVFDLKIGGVTV
jgi:hypothetical protein